MHSKVTLIVVLCLISVVYSVEFRQEELVPEYKSLEVGNVRLDITYEQIYNDISPTYSDHCYGVRIVNNKAVGLDIPELKQKFDLHLLKGTGVTNTRIFEYAGYRTETEEDITYYYTSWSQVDFQDLYVESMSTGRYALCLRIDDPWAHGDFNVTFNVSGTEYFLDPEMSACGTMSTPNSIYTLTGNINNDDGDCMALGATNITFDMQGYTIDGDGDTTGSGILVNADNCTVKNGEIKEFRFGFYSVGGVSDFTVDNVTISQATSISVYFIGTNGNSYLKFYNMDLEQTPPLSTIQAFNIRVNDTVIFENVTISGGGQYNAYYGIRIDPKWPNTRTADTYVYLRNVTVTDTNYPLLVECSLNDTITYVISDEDTLFSNIGYANLRIFESEIYCVDGTTIINGGSFDSSVDDVEFYSTSGIDVKSTVYLRNVTDTSGGLLYNFTSSNESVWYQEYIRFNMTDTGKINNITSSYRLNSSLEGEVLNETASLGTWTLLNMSNHTYSANTTFNPYEVNSFPTTTGFNNRTRLNYTFNASGTYALTHGAIIALVACGGPFTDYVLNFTLWDEENVTMDLTGDFEMSFWVTVVGSGDETNFSYHFNDTHFAELCAHPVGTAFNVDAFISYYSNQTEAVYQPRQYLLRNSLLNSSNLQEINLYLLNTTYAKQTTITVKDNTGIGKEAIYLSIQRYYPGENIYRTIAMGKTGTVGYATTYLRPNDIYYKIIAYDVDGVVQEVFTEQFVSCDPSATACELTLQFTVEDVGYYWDYYGNIASSCSFSNATVPLITCTFADTSGLVNTFELKAWKFGATSRDELCSDSSTDSSGTLFCYLPTSITGAVTYSLIAQINPPTVLKTGELNFGQVVAFANFGLLIGFFMILVVALVGVWTGSPGITMVLGGISILGGTLMGLIVMSPAAIFGIMFVILLSLIVMRRD